MIVREIIDDHKQGYYKPGKFESGNVHFVRISDITDDAFLDEASTPMINIELDVIEIFSIKKNDFLFARTGGAGRFCLITDDIHGIFASYLIRFRFNKNYDSYFLRYYFLSDSFQSELKSKIHGGVNQNVHAENIKDCVVPEITLSEQKRIVTILDQCFNAIDQAKANVERNLKNAKELFQSQMNQIFTQKGEGWVEKKLGEVYDVRDGTHDSPKYQEKGFPLVTSKNLKNNSITFEKIKYISQDDYLNINKRSKVDIGDVLLAMIGTIGNPVVITKEPNFAIKNVALFKVPKEHSSRFLGYYLKSKIVVDKMEREAKGTTQRFVGLGYLRSFNIPIPPLDVQQNITRQLDVFNNQTQSLESHYQQELDALDELKKSILQKAFNGEL